MPMFADVIKELIGKLSLNTQDTNELNPVELMGGKGSDNNIMHPNELQSKDPNVIYNDAGSAVDYSNGNPFSKLLQGGEPGTIRNAIQRMISPTPECNQPGSVQGFGTVGGGDPARGTPGTGIDPGLDRTPTKDQRVPGLAPKAQAPINNYAQPSAMNPQQIDELRNSILTDVGQADPNSLAGRMSGPNSSADQHDQMNATQRQHDDLRGFDGSRSQRMKKSEADGSYQVAGDVTPLHPPGTFNSNTQKGDALNGLAKSLGVPPPQNVLPYKKRLT